MSKPALPDYAVIIPHYADPVRLERCLSALMAQDLAGAEVVVADNGSPGDMSALRAAFGTVRFVTQPERGAAAARNKGVEVTQAPWLVFLDADCVPVPDWFRRVRQIAQGDPWVVTGGRIEVFDETPPPRSGAEAFETVFAFDQERYIREVGFSVTANIVTSRSVFEAAGPMIVGLSEDVDWCRRAVAAGAKLRYDAELSVAHPTRSDWPALRKKWCRLTQEGFGLNGAGVPRRLLWLAKAIGMPLSVAAHVPRILRHPALTPAERVSATLTLARLRFIRKGWMMAQAIGS